MTLQRWFYWELMCLPGGLRCHKSSSQALAQERLNLCSLWQMEGRGKASAVFWPTRSLLDLRNTSQGHFSWTWLFSKVLHSNKRLICLKTSMGSSWEVSLLLKNTKEMEMSSCLLWRGGGKRGFQLWVNAAPHVRSLLILRPLEMRNARAK